MTLFIKTPLAALTFSTLMACGGTTIDMPVGGGGGTPPPAPQGNPTTLTASQVQSQRNFINEGFTLDRTGGFDGVPNGTVSYRGQWISGLNTSVQPSANALAGDMNMSIDIGGGTNVLSGSVTDINTLNGNNGIEQLDGSLRISGTMGGFDNEIRSGSRFSGVLSGYLGGTVERDFSVNASLTGRLRDTVSGTANDGRIVTGRTTGTAAFTDGRGGTIDITTGQFRGDSSR